jgi:excisionase family DNA binding protein
MASLFKPVIVSYFTPDGKRCPAGTPGARKKKVKARNWYGQFKDANGKPCRMPLCADKSAAKVMLSKLTVDAKFGQLGLSDPYAEHRRRPLLEHLEDFRGHLAAKGRAPEYIASACRNVRAVLEGCRFTFMDDIQPSAVDEFLAGLRQPQPVPALPDQETFTAAEVGELLNITRFAVGRMARRRLLPCEGTGRARRFRRADVEALLERHTQGAGISTTNHYVTAVKGFTGWLVKDRRTNADPLVHLSRLNAEVDVRRRRRSMSAAEFSRLVEAASVGKPFRGLTGADRVVLYVLAVNTGLRAGELASLSPGSFHLAGDRPALTVEAGYSKHRREDVQTLRPDVAELMQSYTAGKPLHQRLWPGTWDKNAAEMLRLDLEAAGLPYEDGSGMVFDFHGTRHKFLSDLAAAGVHPKLAQILARHSTISQTMDHYTHLEIHDQAAALDKLPALPAPVKSQAPLEVA